MNEKVEISREQLRDAFADASRRNSVERVLECLEAIIFGPPKPVEWRAFVDQAGVLRDGIAHTDGRWRSVLVREVTE